MRKFGRNIPNLISGTRLAATPFLLGLVLYGNQGGFKWLLLACLLSDILDGLIARAFRIRSELGARLDSTADILVSIITTFALFVFQKDVMAAHLTPILVIVAMYAAEATWALLRYGRISSFHTVLCRSAAYAQGIFVMWLFLWGFNPWAFYVMISVSLLAYIEELTLVAMLPEWKADVRGIYWVISAPKEC